jgi:ribosomal protein S18 acetylase RimI-like enzyme
MRALIADTDLLRAAAAKLIERQYAGVGLTGIHYLPDSPYSLTLVVLDDGAVVGTMTLTSDSEAGLLVDKTFPGKAAERSAAGRHACELTKLAFDPAVRSKEALAALFQIAFVYGRARACTDVFIEVHPHHARFYERMLGFVKVGPPCMNLRVNAPAVLLWLDASYVAGQIALHAGTAGRPGAAKSLYPYFPPLFGKSNDDGNDDGEILVAAVHAGDDKAAGKAG